MGQVLTKKKTRRRAKKFGCKEEYFIKNGGVLLEKLVALSNGKEVGAHLKMLSQEEIKNATNDYYPNLIFASLLEANIYKGTLDDRVVFIKTPKQLDPNPELLADLFLTEMSILSVLHHYTMNTIYGCYLETRVPMLVCQYASRSQEYMLLHRCLHGDLGAERRLNWKIRVKVANEVAYALSYMHNALSKPVVHRGVKSFCVLIDAASHNAILANVAHSVSITRGKKGCPKVPVYGTPEYIDPEYKETREVTEKCDVYSFGVLMLELLTGRDPLEMARRGRDLVVEFVSEVGREGMVDAKVLEEGSMVEIQRFGGLALKCVANKGEERPSMISVVEELWDMQTR